MTVTEEGLQCPLCAKRYRGVAECNSIHPTLRISWQWDTEQDYHAMYEHPTAYHEEEQISEGQDSFWHRDAKALVASHMRLDFLESVIGSVRGIPIVDIGCAQGAFVAQCMARGAQAIGVDPCPKVVAQGVSIGRPLFEGTWQNIDKHYDVAALLDCFEHLVNPSECLNHLHDKCKYLMIEMPEWNSSHHKSEGENWRHNRPKQHPILYTRSAAEMLYDRCGWEVVGFYRPLSGSIGKMSHVLRRS